MRLAVARSVFLPVLSALAIGAVWAWLGAPDEMPVNGLGPGDKLYCVSYAPFRDRQSPLDPASARLLAELGVEGT